MCRIMEEMREEAMEEEKKRTALRMLENGKYLIEEIADICGLSSDEVKKLKTERTMQ